jgi:hypothetical protein
MLAAKELFAAAYTPESASCLLSKAWALSIILRSKCSRQPPDGNLSSGRPYPESGSLETSEPAAKWPELYSPIRGRLPVSIPYLTNYAFRMSTSARWAQSIPSNLALSEDLG